MRKPRTFLTLFAVAFLALPGLALAQTGTIEGQLTRDDGTAMGGVAVVLNELGEATITDSNGAFGFAEVPSGTYSLTFTLNDNTATLENVEVSGRDTTNADFAVDWVVSFADTITVVSASRRQERIVDAPSAVSVVTAVEIAREASHGQAPKLIEFTPGAEVTQSGIYDFNVNTRGFNSSLNRRVATLVDGRDPSVPFLGAQEWAAVSYPLDDLSLVEMVRGPAAALYGANASSGVLNMITKRPRDYEGGLIRLTGGELSTFNADLRWAGSLGDGWYFKVVGGIRDHDDWFVSRNETVEYPGLPMEAVPLALESDEISFYGLRFDKYFGSESFLTVEAGDANVEGPPFQTGIGRVQLVDVSRPWARVNYYHPRFNVLAYYNSRDAPEQLALSSGNNLSLDTENVGIEVQANWDLGDGDSRLVVGASYSEDDIDSTDPKTGQQTLVFEPVSADFSALFAQFDLDLGDQWRLVLAGRYDDSSLFSSQFSPKGALVWSVNPNHTLRLTYNEAYQVANYSEFFLQAQVGVFPGCAPRGGLLAVRGVLWVRPGGVRTRVGKREPEAGGDPDDRARLERHSRSEDSLDDGCLFQRVRSVHHRPAADGRHLAGTDQPQLRSLRGAWCGRDPDSGCDSHGSGADVHSGSCRDQQHRRHADHRRRVLHQLR